jgi:hypothetical protein
MARSILLSALSLASLALARNCQNITVELDLSARNSVFDLEIPKTNIEITEFVLELTKQGANYGSSILTGVS